MSKKKDSIYVEFQDLFKEVKTRSELKSRSMEDEVIDRFIITDTDKPTLKIFYEDAVSDIAERLGVLDRMQDYGGTTIYKLTELETEEKAKKTKNLLKRCFVNQLLFEWYRSVGRSALAQEFLQFFERYLKEYRTNSTQPSFVKPNYKPYM